MPTQETLSGGQMMQLACPWIRPSGTYEHHIVFSVDLLRYVLKATGTSSLRPLWQESLTWVQRDGHGANGTYRSICCPGVHAAGRIIAFNPAMALQGACSSLMTSMQVSIPYMPLHPSMPVLLIGMPNIFMIVTDR